MSSAWPGWGLAGPSGPHKQPSASDSAGRPLPGVSAPWNCDKLLARLQEGQEPSSYLRTPPSPPLRSQGEEVVIGAAGM